MALRLDQFQTFVDGYTKHPEAGLKACEKKLKKDPQNTLYLIAQAQFQWKLRQYSDALTSCHQVLNLTQKDKLDSVLLSEIQFTIAECQHGLQTFNHLAGSQLAAYWKQVLDNAKGPPAKKVRSEMLRAAWRDEYWDLAQQLFARLQKESPTLPQYHFAWISFSQLQADAMSQDDKMGQSLKMLAFRSLKSAFDNTLNDKETTRKISSSHHLRLATQIYRQQNQLDDILSLLRDPKVGIDSAIGMGDGEFKRCEIEILTEKKQYERVFELCLSKLDRLITAKESKEDATVIEALLEADDWFTWNALLESGQEIPKPETKDQINKIIERFLELEPGNRNAGRALLTNQANQKSRLLDTCLRFFDSNCTKTSCFRDLKDFLTRVSHSEQAKFLNHIDTAAKAHNPIVDAENTDKVKEKEPQDALRWVAVNINALKFEYFLCVSKVPLPEKESLENFVSDSLRMYKLALGINKECGDEACILAVVGLVKLHHFSRDYDLDDRHPQPGTPEKKSTGNTKFSPKSYIVQAVFLLEFLKSNSYHNYSAALLLTTIYQMLGLTALAATGPEPLNIKEVQHDTISHIFWNRISISHPFDCKPSLITRVSQTSTITTSTSRVSTPYANPAAGLDTALYWYDAAADRTIQLMGDMLENVPFDKIKEFSEFKGKFENSFSRATMVLESRRVDRLTNETSLTDTLPSTFGQWIQDNRDFDTIPDFEYATTDKFSTFVTTRPTPMRYWLARHTVNDILLSLPTLKTPLPPYLVSLLGSSLAYLTDNASDSIYQLTLSEQFVAGGWTLLQRIIIHLFISASDPFASKNVSKDIDSLLAWTSALQKTPAPQLPKPATADPGDLLPTADLLQDTFLRLEVLQAIARTAADIASASASASANAKAKAALPAPAKAALAKTKAAAVDAGKAINAAARAWRDSVKSHGSALVSRLLAAGATGDDVAEILELGSGGGSRVVGVQEVLEAAIDSIEGVEKVRVR